MKEEKWELMNFKQHHNEDYVISRLPKEAKEELNALLTAVALTGRYEFGVSDESEYYPYDQFVFKWKQESGTYEIAFSLNDDKHELIELTFAGLTGLISGPNKGIVFSTKNDNMSPSQIIRIARNYV